MAPMGREPTSEKPLKGYINSVRSPFAGHKFGVESFIAESFFSPGGRGRAFGLRFVPEILLTLR